MKFAPDLDRKTAIEPTFPSLGFFVNPYKGKDDEQGIRKLATWTGLGLYTGSFVGLSDVLCRTQPATYTGSAARIASIAVPAALMGAAFGTTTLVAASVRGKSDPYNHMLGGCAAGAVLGARMKSVKMGTGMCLGLGAVAFVTRGLEMEGNLQFIPKGYEDGLIAGPGLWNWDRSFDPFRKEPNRNIDK
ncbi:NADH dehydrogenase [ubiquinone] 1 alpha subcomplex subunit 11-like [Tubulanus polymorphus]|uniref:NADH dehydrogenase [ubiquinone] 1 alpha subcomplex subunit 11-like n=1 Tax=Tubulanus polymorphus TaxID=672921 RepID=UPI003DA479DF